jgi:hypothetical protein
MSCAEFEREWVALLDEREDAPDRAARVEALLRHADACPGCRSARGLAELLSRPAAERDPLDEPPAGYWDGFNERLAERIRLEESAAASRRLRVALGAVAALLLLAVAAALWPRVATRGPVAPAPELAAVEAAPAAGGEVEEPAIPPELDRLFAADVLPDAGADWLPAPLPTGDAFEDGLWLPDVLDLDAEGRRRLLDWIRAEDARLLGGQA